MFVTSFLTNLNIETICNQILWILCTVLISKKGITPETLPQFPLGDQDLSQPWLSGSNSLPQATDYGQQQLNSHVKPHTF